jgi:hypothetical protein
VASSQDTDEEATEVDVQVDQPSLITASVETTAPGLPADGEPETITRSDTRRAVLPAAAALGPKAPLPPRVAMEDPSVSLITPRFATDALVKAERAVAAGAEESPADEEPDTSEIGKLPRPGQAARAVASSDDDEEPTIEPRPRTDTEAEEDRTVPKVPSAGAVPKVPLDEVVAKTEPLPAKRRQLDSEAAGHGPPWHSQADEALGSLPSPVGTSEATTKELPRSTIDEALGSLRAQIESNLARSAAIATQPLSFSAAVAAAHTGPASDKPHATPLPVEPAANVPRAPGVEPALAASAGVASERLHSPRRPAEPEGGISPVTVFFLTFTLAGSLLGGIVAAHHYGWFGALRAKLSSPATPASSPAIEPSASARPRSSPPASAASAATSASPPTYASAVASASAALSATALPSASLPRRLRKRDEDEGQASPPALEKRRKGR